MKIENNQQQQSAHHSLLVTVFTSLTTVFQDLRFGMRQIIKNPGFTTVAVLSLALGIGISTAVFSLVNAILLSSLPVPNPQELRVIQWSGGDPQIGTYSGCVLDDGLNRKKADSVPYPVFTTFREQCAGKADVFGYSAIGEITVIARHESFIAEGLMVSDNFFSGLHAKPVIGRLFTPGETSVDEAQGVVITYPWWESHFNLDPSALGQSITLNGHSFTIIGVLPQGFSGVSVGGKTEFYVSMATQPQLKADWPLTDSNLWWVRLMARKKTGISDKQLQSVMDVTFSAIAKEIMKEGRILITDGHQGGFSLDRDYYRKPLLLLLSLVGIVILVVCANLAGLMLSRGAARYHEFAVRAAIGAGRFRLIRQTLTESLLLSLLGGGMGIVIAMWGKDAISRLLSGSPGGLHYDTSLDLKVLGFTLAITISTAILSGLLPALRAAYANPLDGLKARTLIGSPRLRSGKILVVTQISLSLLLLTGAGLYVRTLINIVQINPGFSMDNLLLIQTNLASAGYKGAATTDYFVRAEASLAAIPGVKSAAVTQYALLGGWMSGGDFFTLPNHHAADGSRPNAHRITVSETFFSTMGIPLRAGREFTASDVDGAPKVIVVNETFVKKYLPDTYPIGQILRANETDWQIAGVCADAKYTDIKGEVPPTVYFSHRQDRIHAGFLAVRTALPPASIMKAARQTLASIDPNVPVIKVISQKQVRDEKIAQEWMFAILCGSLAFMAVLLSCIGIYGLMAFNVTRRTNEIGIRMALGATRLHIIWPILRETLFIASAGILVGMPSAFAITRLIRSQLYGIEPDDPTTILLTVITIFVIAILSAWFPARRASRIEPNTSLRYE